MSRQINPKLKAAKDAIDAMFADRTVSLDEALDNMLEVQEEVDEKVDCLRSDMNRREDMDWSVDLWRWCLFTPPQLPPLGPWWST